MSLAKEEKILDAALRVFVQFGFRRVTMNEIAEEAGISRPGLYLVFKSKEQVFAEVVRRALASHLAEVQRVLGAAAHPHDAVRAAFEVWAVRDFDASHRSPEAREVLEATRDSAREVYEEGFQRFEALLATVLPARGDLAPEDLAHLLCGALRGFKSVAADGRELSRLIDQLLGALGL